MSSIVYQTDRRSGTKYAYRAESYRDPETGRPKSRREYLGRVDPATGEIVPKAAPGRRNRSRLGEPGEGAPPSELRRALEEALDDARRQRSRVAELEEEVSRLTRAIAGADGLAAAASELLRGALDGIGGQVG